MIVRRDDVWFAHRFAYLRPVYRHIGEVHAFEKVLALGLVFVDPTVDLDRLSKDAAMFAIETFAWIDAGLSRRTRVSRTIR